MLRNPIKASLRWLWVLGLVSLVSACGSQIVSTHSGDTYGRSELGRPISVKQAVVLSTRIVNIAGTSSGVGAVSGAATGAVLGTRIGDSDVSRIAGGIVGGVVGGVAGAIAERQLTKDEAYEVTLRLDDGETLIVVQDGAERFVANQRVLLLEGDKLRVTADNSTTGKDKGVAEQQSSD